jgi:hypothetical protein
MSYQLDLVIQDIEVFRKRKLTEEELSFLVKIDEENPIENFYYGIDKEAEMINLYQEKFGKLGLDWGSILEYESLYRKISKESIQRT